MKAKVNTYVFALTFLILSTQATVSNEKYENITIIDGTSLNHTTQQVVGGKPIVIHTQLQHYDQPTLKDYQECHENLQKCKKVCEGVENPVSCIKECPVCPFLVKEKIVIQGINDTDYIPAALQPENTTNIIRLTNQIRNIIDSHSGDITYRNENNVHIYQNVSKVGGKYGLGYNNTDPCCIILRSLKSCEVKRFSTSTPCHHKRHRVCGKQCKSRVMMTKRVTLCESPTSLDSSEENCHESIKYIPYNPRMKQRARHRNKCMSIQSWPYVVCGQMEGNYQNLICKRCLNLPYYYILNNGIPDECSRCFMIYSRPRPELYPPSWHPAMSPPIIDTDYDIGDDFDFNMDSWHQDKKKCRLPNGTISENCHENEGSGTEEETSSTPYPWGQFPEAQDDYIDYYNNEDNRLPNFYENARRRRHTFTRSKYSRRYRQ